MGRRGGVAASDGGGERRGGGARAAAGAAPEARGRRLGARGPKVEKSNKNETDADWAGAISTDFGQLGTKFATSRQEQGLDFHKGRW